MNATDKQFQDMLVAAMMGKDVDRWIFFLHTPKGRMTEPVMDFMAKEMPAAWKQYLFECWKINIPLPERLTNLLSLANLTQFILDNYREMPEYIIKRLKDGGIIA